MEGGWKNLAGFQNFSIHSTVFTRLFSQKKKKQKLFTLPNPNAPGATINPLSSWGQATRVKDDHCRTITERRTHPAPRPRASAIFEPRPRGSSPSSNPASWTTQVSAILLCFFFFKKKKGWP